MALQNNTDSNRNSSTANNNNLGKRKQMSSYSLAADTNDDKWCDCGIIRVSQSCCSIQGVIAGDNSFSIIHIAPALYGEYCHTATICLDLIS